MRLRLVFFPGVLFAILLVPWVISPSASDAPPASPHGAILAPPFILTDVEGKARSLMDYRGKVVYLYFTTTWCPYCKRDIPRLKELHASLKARQFVILAVYVNESAQKVRAFVKKYEIPYTVLVDDEAQVARLYGVRGVPMRVVVDPKGMIACYMCADAEKSILGLLKGR